MTHCFDIKAKRKRIGALQRVLVIGIIIIFGMKQNALLSFDLPSILVLKMVLAVLAGIKFLCMSVVS